MSLHRTAGTPAIDSLTPRRDDVVGGIAYEPDELRLTIALEAVRDVLAVRRSQVHRLECVEALLGPARPSHTVHEPAAVEPRAQRKPAKRASVKHPTRAQLREHISANAPSSRRELLDTFGGTGTALEKKLRTMLRAGELRVEGKRGARQYYPLDAPVKLPRPELVRDAALPDRGVYPVYDVISDRGGATTAQLARLTGLPAALVVEEGRRLVQLGLVSFTEAGQTRKWLPVPRPEQRSVAA
jgi:predicted transcriptional regulator